MSIVTSDLVRAQEDFIYALERALGSATEVVGHREGCIKCKLSLKCDDLAKLDRKRLLDVGKVEELKTTYTEKLDCSNVVYKLVELIAGDEESQYNEAAKKILTEKGDKHGS